LNIKLALPGLLLALSAATLSGDTVDRWYDGRSYSAPVSAAVGGVTDPHAENSADSDGSLVKWKRPHKVDPPGHVPEPSTVLLLGSALAGLAAYSLRARRNTGGSGD
jgi:hypothetical protein